MKRARKAVSILVTLAMLVGLLLPMGTPAFAASENRVATVPSVADDYKGALGTLTLKEDPDFASDFAAGKTFTVTFPSGVKIKNTVTNAVYWSNAGINAGAYANLTGAEVTISGDYTMDIKIPAGVTDVVDALQIRPIVELDGFAGGDIEVTVDSFDSGITGGKYVIGRVATGDTTASVLKVETIGQTGAAKAGTIRITENAVSAIGDDPQTITLKLPNDFSWNLASMWDGAAVQNSSVQFLAGLATSAVTKMEVNGRSLTITFDPVNTRTQRGVIQIVPYFTASDDADFGDVEIELSGSKVDDADLVVAKYADFGVEVKADGDVEEIQAGKFNQELTELVIKENVPKSLVEGRKFTVSFPSWVKVMSVTEKTETGGWSLTPEAIAGDDNKFDVTVTTASTTKGEYKVLVKVSVQADKAGDIEATIDGKAGVEGKVLLGKALAPVTATADAKEIKIGVQGQTIGDIVIAESKDEYIAAKKDIVVELPENVEWDGTPTIEVIEGNLEIDEDSIDTTDEVLTFTVKSDSSKPAKIKISGAKVTVDRTVAEGPVVAKVKGAAIVSNDKGQGNANSLEAGEFDVTTVAKVVVANVVTPAPEAGTVLFNIGSSVYTAGGVTKVMDAAPYVKEGRTYVPVRYLALALGVSEDNIKYENGVVTLVKADVTLKLTIGSKELVKNDAITAMDIAPEVVNGRTMLPARFVAEGFGALVGYANGQVVISQ